MRQVGWSLGLGLFEAENVFHVNTIHIINLLSNIL